MVTPKKQIRHVLRELPENTKLEEIQYHSHVRQKVHRGIDDADAGRTVSQAEMNKRLARWLDRSGESKRR